MDEELTAVQRAAGERQAMAHDEGRPEDWAAEAVPDPWEEASDGELDPGPVPGGAAR